MAEFSPRAQAIRESGPIFQRSLRIAQQSEAAQLAQQREQRMAESSRLSQERASRMEALAIAKADAKKLGDLAAASHAETVAKREGEFFANYLALSSSVSPTDPAHATAILNLSAAYPELSDNKRVTSALSLARGVLNKVKPPTTAPALPEGATVTGGTTNGTRWTMQPPVDPQQKLTQDLETAKAKQTQSLQIADQAKTQGRQREIQDRMLESAKLGVIALGRKDEQGVFVGGEEGATVVRVPNGKEQMLVPIEEFRRNVAEAQARAGGAAPEQPKQKIRMTLDKDGNLVPVE